MKTRKEIEKLIKQINEKMTIMNMANILRNQFNAQFYKRTCILYHNENFFRMGKLKRIYDILLGYLELIK